MIHMLSRFDLRPQIDFKTFEEDYEKFVEQMKLLGLADGTGKIGRRIGDTPMDTDLNDAPAYYAIMTFSDRDQLDRAYEYLLVGDRRSEDWETHRKVNDAVVNSVFTCWQDET